MFLHSNAYKLFLRICFYSWPRKSEKTHIKYTCMRRGAKMPKLSIGEKKLQQLKAMPLLKQRLFKTRDGRFVVNQTTISTLKPVQYYEKILDSLVEEDF